MKIQYLKYSIILFFALFLVFTHGCYYDNEERLYPDISNDCDTIAVTFSGSTKSILQASCLSCHSNSNSSSLGGGIQLEDYSDLSAVLSNGSLMGSIRHESGFSPMPKGGGMLSNCEINQLEAWINNGALNN